MKVLSLRMPFVGSLLALCSSALVGQTPVDTAATVAAAEQAAQAWLAIVDKGDIAQELGRGRRRLSARGDSGKVAAGGEECARAA